MAKGKTRLTITLTNCDDCTITAQPSVDWASPNAWTFRVWGTVKNGVVVLTVPTSYTRGLWFAVGCPGDVCNSSNAEPVVALKYPGKAVGDLVSDSQAKTQERASGCWIGTTAQRASLAFTRTVFPDEITLRLAHSIRVWANPQVGVIPNTWQDTYRGGLGTQNYWTCTPFAH